MTIYEPATLLTDLLLAALASGLAWRLKSHAHAGATAMGWWSGALGLTALSALVGGSYHGFAPNLPPAIADAWWLATLLIIGALSAVMALSLMHELVPPGRRKYWRGLIIFKFAAFAGAATVYPAFIVAIIDYGLTMFAWAVAALLTRRAWRHGMLAAITLSALAALVQQLHWGVSAQFNHNDLYHVVQALALVAFYRAGRAFSNAARVKEDGAAAENLPT